MKMIRFKIVPWCCLSVLLVLVRPPFLHAQEPVNSGEPEPQAESGAAAGPIQVASVRHVNSALVLFDEHERQYVIRDGAYSSEEGVSVVIADGRIQRFVGCGDHPCDFTTYSTRVVGRQLLVYAEMALPDGRYRRDGGSWFRVAGGELVEYFDAGS
jgi:hypothetical protein